MPPLLEEIRDGGAREQRNAALVLGILRDLRGFLPLTKAARDDTHHYVPSFAVLALGRYEREEALDLLEQLVKAKKRDHRRIAAILAIAKIGGPRAFSLLEPLARTEKRHLVREAAIFSLGFFRSRALVRGDDGEPEPVPAIRAALTSSIVGHRKAAHLALALLGHRALRGYHEAAARNEREDAEVRAVAILALGRFPDEDVTRILLSILDDPTESAAVQTMAAFALKDRKDPAALEMLKHANRKPIRDENVRSALTLALSNFEDEEVVEILTLRLQDRHDQVRSAGAIALSRLTVPEWKEKAIDRLSRMLQGEFGRLDPLVFDNMHRARDLLRKGEAPGEFHWLGNRKFAEDLPKDVEEKVVDLVNDEAEHVLELTNLTQITAGRRDGQRFRVDDEGSDLRDLKEHLDRHPYFEPADIPVPELAITPRDPAARGGSPKESDAKEGPEGNGR